jgi:starch synthase
LQPRDPTLTVEQAQSRSGSRIGFLCEGNAETYHAFSGTAKGIVDHLRLMGNTVVTVDVRPPKPVRALNGLLSWSANRDRWRAKFRYGDFAFRARSKRAAQAAQNIPDLDLIFQIGATFAPPPFFPYVLYCDWNMALSIRNRAAGRASTNGMTDAETRAINDCQATIYRGAQLIFTICERLRQSFIDDYGIPGERVVRAYPGVNFSSEDIKTVMSNRASDGPPTVLFVGKEFERKGGATLVEAFRILRQRISDAKLVIIGADHAPTNEPGIENLGVLLKSVAAEKAALLRAFARATVFCLPSRLDPFPNVVREAMVLGLPCVTTNIWAFPEMVIDGQTGFTVPPDDPHTLADRLEKLLRNRELAKQMGTAGQRYAETEFTWTNCAATMHSEIENHLPTLMRTRQ